MWDILPTFCAVLIYHYYVCVYVKKRTRKCMEQRGHQLPKVLIVKLIEKCRFQPKLCCARWSGSSFSLFFLSFFHCVLQLFFFFLSCKKITQGVSKSNLLDIRLVIKGEKTGWLSLSTIIHEETNVAQRGKLCMKWRGLYRWHCTVALNILQTSTDPVGSEPRQVMLPDCACIGCVRSGEWLGIVHVWTSSTSNSASLSVTCIFHNFFNSTTGIGRLTQVSIWLQQQL